MALPLPLTGWGPAWPLRAIGAWLRRRVPPRDHRVVTMALALPDGRAWSHDIGRGGATVRCAAGSALLTREGDPEDRVLSAGECFRSERPGRIALLALGDAEVAISGDLRRADRGSARVPRLR